MTKRIVSLVLAMLIVMSCICVAQAATKSVTLNKTKKTLYITTDNANPYTQLTATTSPKDAEVTWTSSDKSVAKVNSKGKVTAIGEGTCTITCALTAKPSVSATCKIVVAKQTPTAMALSKSEKTLYITTTKANPAYTLKAVPSPANAFMPDITGWESSDTEVATVDENGKVTAVTTGAATVTASFSNGMTASCNITVALQPVKTLTLSKTAKTLTITSEKAHPAYTLTYTYEPADAFFPGVKWISNNTNAATVDENGKITAVAPGAARIYCKLSDGSLKPYCLVTVKNQLVTKVALNVTSKTLTIKPSNLKPTYTLKATVTPDTAVSKKVTWTSSNTKVATVSSKGVVTAKSAGTATITCTAADGSGKKATCKITVKKQAPSLSFKNAHVYYSYGYPKLSVVFVNNTYDTIDRIDFRAEYFDIYGKKVYGYGYYTHDNNWLSTTIKPGETSGNDWYWDAWGYDGAYSVKITLLKYHTTSGKTVTLR